MNILRTLSMKREERALERANEVLQRRAALGHTFAEPELANMAKVATDLGAMMYPGGWVQLMNWANLGNYPAPAKNTYTSIADITATSEVNAPCLPALSLKVGAQLHIVTWGTSGSAAGTATTTIGHYLNGAASGTQMSISASQTPATSTVNNWRLESYAVVSAIGSSGTILTSGILLGLNATATTNVLVPTTQPSAAAINTENNNGITTAASWSLSAAGNTYTVNGHMVFLFN